MIKLKIMELKKKMKAYKDDLLMVLVTNHCAKRYVEIQNSKLMENDREKLAEELGILRKSAVKFETDHPDKSKLSDKDKKNIEAIKSGITDINTKLESMDLVEQQVKKMDMRLKEALFMYRNFDTLTNEIIKELK